MWCSSNLASSVDYAAHDRLHGYRSLCFGVLGEDTPAPITLSGRLVAVLCVASGL